MRIDRLKRLDGDDRISGDRLYMSGIMKQPHTGSAGRWRYEIGMSNFNLPPTYQVRAKGDEWASNYEY